MVSFVMLHTCFHIVIPQKSSRSIVISYFSRQKSSCCNPIAFIVLHTKLVTGTICSRLNSQKHRKLFHPPPASRKPPEDRKPQRLPVVISRKIIEATWTMEQVPLHKERTQTSILRGNGAKFSSRYQ